MPADSFKPAVLQPAAPHRPHGPGYKQGTRSFLSVTGDKSKTRREKIEVLAREFESVFTNQLLKTMRSTIHKSGLVDGGNAEKIYTGMLDEELARQMAFKQGGGLSSMIVEQLVGKAPEPGKKDGVMSQHPVQPPHSLLEENRPKTDIETGPGSDNDKERVK